VSKADLLKQAQKAGLAPDSAGADDYTEDQLRALLNPSDSPAWKGSMSSKEPLVGPDGHEHLSAEDIKARG
jgi:hypothetical protein